MKHALTSLSALALALCAGSSAQAGILWQETFAADPSGHTFVQPFSSPQLPLQDLYLQLTGGQFESVNWASWDTYTKLWWEYDYGYGWYLNGNEYFRSDVGVVKGGLNWSWFDYIPLKTFDFCLAPGPHVAFRTCGVFDDGGAVLFDSALVSAQGDFTLTLWDQPQGGVPEPAAWALMVVGFGGLGLTLRRRRSAAPALDFGARP